METKATGDVVLGAGAMTAPLWVETATAWGDLVLVTGGVILVSIRIWAALRE